MKIQKLSLEAYLHSSSCVGKRFAVIVVLLAFEFMALVAVTIASSISGVAGRRSS
jgi:hypothetical protein